MNIPLYLDCANVRRLIVLVINEDFQVLDSAAFKSKSNFVDRIECPRSQGTIVVYPSFLRFCGVSNSLYSDGEEKVKGFLYVNFQIAYTNRKLRKDEEINLAKLSDLMVPIEAVPSNRRKRSRQPDQIPKPEKPE